MSNVRPVSHGRFCVIAISAAGLLASATVAVAQDGLLISRDTVSVPGELRDFLAAPLDRNGFDIDEVLENVSIQRIAYLSDGLRVSGYLVEPSKGDGLPAVIFNRGGNRDFGALNDTTAAFLLAPLAAHGYVVVASQYRGNAGGEGREEFGGADVNDVINLLPLLDRHPRVDSSRIGMYGWSRGGMMTYLALARTDRIRAAVIGGGMADAFATVRGRPEMEEGVFAELVPDWSTDREASLEARSPIRWPERLHKATPILLLHGSADWRVHPTEALGMAAALHEARHPFRMIFYEGGDHGLSEHQSDVNRSIFEWLDRYVRDRAPLPDLEPHGR